MTSRPDVADATVPETLETFVALHYRRLVRLAGLVCMDQTDAQDAVQNGLLRAWRNRHRLRDPARLKPWLDAIVVRESIRLNGRAARLIRALTRWPPEPNIVPGPATSSAAQELVEALRSLPAPQRAAVALHFEAGYSLAETAELLEVPLETARSRLRLARKRLRREFAEEDT